MDQSVSPTAPIPVELEYYDLGSFHCPVTCANRDAQIWFDRGLIWSYAFNHEEAIVCFEQAIAHDSSCAMAYWGLVYALGPNYNMPWEVFGVNQLKNTGERMRAAEEKAKANATNASPIEQALIKALERRCPAAEDAGKDFSVWNQTYADAMELVYQRFPEDVNVAALYADALMNLTPWQMWDLSSGEPCKGARSIEVKQILERALLREGVLHAGLLHLYIHLMEMSSTPEAALTAADQLRGLVPDSGHLQHMSSHIQVLCGDYRACIASNADAIRADQLFLARRGPMNFYSIYRTHNYHFLIYGAMFAGQSRVALETVSQMEASIPEALLRVKEPPMVDFMEGLLSVRVEVLVRFGRWQELLEVKSPSDTELCCMTEAMVHYGKGVALAAFGRVDEAVEERVLFRKAVARVPQTRMLFNNKCVDVLKVASAMLDGELDYRRGDYDMGLAHLLRSIALEDALPYQEPWGWMQPTRHAYGALLLEQGHVERAAAVYRADLGFDETLPRALRHPNNVWALHGYHECLGKLGRAEEANIIKQQLKLAAATADIPITSSCFCRKRGEDSGTNVSSRIEL